MSALKIFVKGALLPPNEIRRLGFLYAAKSTAMQFEKRTGQSVAQLLIRADAHPNTYDVTRRRWVKDGWHLTIDIKTPEMATSKKHITLHGYMAMELDGNVLNMFNVNKVLAKGEPEGTPKEENDAYYDSKKERNVNNWDLKNLVEIEEPKELRNIVLGKDFISILTPDLIASKQAEAVREEEEAIKEQEKLSQEREAREEMEK